MKEKKQTKNGGTWRLPHQNIPDRHQWARGPASPIAYVGTNCIYDKFIVIGKIVIDSTSDSSFSDVWKRNLATQMEYFSIWSSAHLLISPKIEINFTKIRGLRRPIWDLSPIWYISYISLKITSLSHIVTRLQMSTGIESRQIKLNSYLKFSNASFWDDEPEVRAILASGMLAASFWRLRPPNLF